MPPKKTTIVSKTSKKKPVKKNSDSENESELDDVVETPKKKTVKSDSENDDSDHEHNDSDTEETKPNNKKKAVNKKKKQDDVEPDKHQPDPVETKQDEPQETNETVTNWGDMEQNDVHEVKNVTKLDKPTNMRKDHTKNNYGRRNEKRFTDTHHNSKETKNEEHEKQVSKPVDKTYAKYDMKSGKRVGINKNSQALKFSYENYDNVTNPVFEVSTEDLLRVIVARAFKEGQMTLKRSLEYVLRAMNHECTFPMSTE